MSDRRYRVIVWQGTEEVVLGDYDSLDEAHNAVAECVSKGELTPSDRVFLYEKVLKFHISPGIWRQYITYEEEE